jgi:5-formyltetrahydrofolate cyclo-ligase
MLRYAAAGVAQVGIDPPRQPRTHAAVRHLGAVGRVVELQHGRKARMRREVLARRDAMPPDHRARASASLRAHLAGLPQVRTARTLLAFASFGSEVVLDPFLADRIGAGVGVFLPYVARMSPPRLEMVRVTDLDADLVPGRMGIREPIRRGRRPARVDRLDVVIAPGVAFDRAGGRLGYGGGFYDGLLPRLRPGTPVIGVAFATQLVDHVPRDDRDLPVDMIVTEDGVVR